MAGPDSPVRKTMSLSLAEFHRGLRALSPAIELADGQTHAMIRAGSHDVAVTYEPQQGTVLGGLLMLPRAVVEIDISGMEEGAARAFLERFDKAFQRGGG